MGGRFVDTVLRTIAILIWLRTAGRLVGVWKGRGVHHLVERFMQMDGDTRLSY
jgi:hypothetical protein